MALLSHTHAPQQSLVKLSPEHTEFRQLDLAWMDHCEKVRMLRQRTPSEVLSVCDDHSPHHK